MTIDELKAKVDAYLGMTGEVMFNGDTPKSIMYTSPTGVELFSVLVTVSIGMGKNASYACGGITGGLPLSWSALMGMNDD